MPGKLELLTVNNLNGGLNTRAHPTLINDNQVSSCVNVDFDTPGIVYQRSGYERVLDSISAVNAPEGAGILNTTTGLSTMVVKVNGTFYYATPTSTAWSTLAGGYSASESTYDIYNDKLYIYNPTDSLLEWTGSGGFTAYASAPKGKYGKIFNDRAFVAGVSGNLSRLYYSVIGNPTDFAGAGASYIDINKNDGYTITGLGIAEGSLIVHKGKGGVYQISFDSSSVPSATRAAAFKGTIRHQTIAQVDSASMYLADDSVRNMGQLPYYPASQHDSEVSIDIRPTVTSLKSAASTLASALYANNKYYLAAPIGNLVYNDTVFTYAYGAWSIYNNVYANQFLYWNGYVHFWDSRSAQMYRFNSSVKSDDGSAIYSIIQTKAYPLTTEYGRKQILGVNTRMLADEGETVTIGYSKNFASYTTTANIAPSVSSSSNGTVAPPFGDYTAYFGSYLFPFGGSGLTAADQVFMSSRWSFTDKVNYIQLQFTANTVNKSWGLLSLDFDLNREPYNDWFNVNSTVS